MELTKFTLKELKESKLENFSEHLKDFNYQELSNLYREYRQKMGKMMLLDAGEVEKFYLLEGYLGSKFNTEYNKTLDYLDNSRKK